MAAGPRLTNSIAPPAGDSLDTLALLLDRLFLCDCTSFQRERSSSILHPTYSYLSIPPDNAYSVNAVGPSRL